MLKKAVSTTGLIFFALYLLSALKVAADTVSTPLRLFGLGDIRTLAVSPDRRFMASAGQGGAFLWDFQTGDLLERLDSEWSVTALAFSPDSKTLLGANGATVRSWNAESGGHIRDYFGQQGEITQLIFTADGQKFISASADNTARLYSLSGGLFYIVRTPGSSITSCALSPDGKTLATTGSYLTNAVQLWDLTSPPETPPRFLAKTNWNAQKVLFTTAGQLVTTSADRNVTLWDTQTTEPIRSFTGITNPIAIALEIWFPTTNTMAAACNDGAVFHWNLDTAEIIQTYRDDSNLAVTGLSGRLKTIVANPDNIIRHRDLSTTNTIRAFRGHTTSSHSGVAISPNGQYVLSGGTEAATRLWNRQTTEPIREYLGHGGGTSTPQFSRDGSKILTTFGHPPAAQLWNTETGQLERELKWTTGWPMGAVFSPDSTKIATRAQDGIIRLFDAANGNQIRTMQNAAFASALAFSPTAPLLAAATQSPNLTDYGADLYNYETGQLLHSFTNIFGPVVAITFSPNGDTLLVAWSDGYIALYNTFTMELRRDFFTPAAYLNDAVYSPDGQYSLTGEGWPLCTATLWDAQSLKSLRTFSGHKWSVDSVAFSPDGSTILTGAEIVREWSIAPFAARLRIQKTPTNTQITWTFGQLQHALQPNGPWETITNAPNPYIPPDGDPARFYQVLTPVLE